MHAHIGKDFISYVRGTIQRTPNRTIVFFVHIQRHGSDIIAPYAYNYIHNESYHNKESFFSNCATMRSSTMCLITGK